MASTSIDRQGANGTYWGSIADIEWGTGLSASQIGKLNKQLIKAGLITRERRSGGTSVTRCLLTTSKAVKQVPTLDFDDNDEPFVRRIKAGVVKPDCSFDVEAHGRKLSFQRYVDERNYKYFYAGKLEDGRTAFLDWHYQPHGFATKREEEIARIAALMKPADQ